MLKYLFNIGKKKKEGTEKADLTNQSIHNNYNQRVHADEGINTAFGT